MKGRGMTVLFAVAHFFAEAACAFVMARFAVSDGSLFKLSAVFLLCTFGFQPLLGLLADVVNRNTVMASAGCALIALSFFFRGSPLWVAVICGLGNSAFHTGAGLDVLNTSDRRLWLLALYMSPDVLGLYCGFVWQQMAGNYYLWPAIVIYVIALLVLFFSSLNRREFRSGNAKFSLSAFGDPARSSGMIALMISAALIPTVMNRQLHFVNHFGAFSLYCALSYMAGKLFGGSISKFIGVLPTTIAAAAATGIAAAFPASEKVVLATAFAAGVLFPAAYWSAAWLLPDTKGLAMGLLSFALGGGLVFAAGVNPDLGSFGTLIASAACAALTAYGAYRATATPPSSNLCDK